MTEGQQASAAGWAILGALQDSGNSLESAAPPFDISASAASIHSDGEARDLLLPVTSPEARVVLTGDEIEDETPPFDSAADATAIRRKAQARGLLSRYGASKEDRRRFWGQLSSPDQERLVAAGRVAQFTAGTTIAQQGDLATHLFVLINGVIKVTTVGRDGQQSVLALRGSGDVVGELAGELTGELTGYRTASMVAVTEVQAVVVGHEKFLSFLDGHLPAAHAYRRMVVQRFSEIADSRHAHSTTSGAQRLAQLLLDLAEKYGEPAGPALVLTLPLSQDELASLVSASRATVARALHDWRGRGLVQTRTSRITITDPAALRRMGGRI